jgi:hypothetical protein
MNILRRGRAEWISYKEMEEKKMPQRVNTSGKTTVTREIPLH